MYARKAISASQRLVTAVHHAIDGVHVRAIKALQPLAASKMHRVDTDYAQR
jgi:hypothetical protein